MLNSTTVSRSDPDGRVPLSPRCGLPVAPGFPEICASVQPCLANQNTCLVGSPIDPQEAWVVTGASVVGVALAEPLRRPPVRRRTRW